MIIKNIYKRFYNDYLMSSRLNEYEDLIKHLTDEGYEIISVIEYHLRLNNGRINPEEKLFINRHDIDTDVKTAKEMFTIEKKYGAYASYYFRLQTIDIPLMKVIHAYGSEASYHFEELATVSKKLGLKTQEDAIKHLKQIKREFKTNFIALEKSLGFKIKSIASHGDFANRALNLTNHPITNDIELRKELHIDAEAYDDNLYSSFDIYISDRMPPEKYAPISPAEAIKQNHKIICMLSHPKQWHVNWLDTSKENITRLIEGLKWKRQ